MTYLYRVTLAGLKGFFRLYKIGARQSLYSFHKQLRSDLEFPQDQLILFKALNEAGEVVARYGLFDLGQGTVDMVTMADTVRDAVTSFVYFYDVTNKKSVIITFEGETPDEATLPVLIESKGPNPIEFENGYVAFEDLPDPKRKLPSEEGEDDDEDDEDEEEGGKKKKKGKKTLADMLGIDEDDLEEDDEEDEDDDDDDEDIEEEEQIYDEDEDAL